MNINYLSSKILSNKNVIKQNIHLSSAKSFLEKLNVVKTNLSSLEAKEVTEDFLPILASESKNIVYRAIE